MDAEGRPIVMKLSSFSGSHKPNSDGIMCRLKRHIPRPGILPLGLPVGGSRSALVQVGAGELVRRRRLGALLAEVGLKGRGQGLRKALCSHGQWVGPRARVALAINSD